MIMALEKPGKLWEFFSYFVATLVMVQRINKDKLEIFTLTK